LAKAHLWVLLVAVCSALLWVRWVAVLVLALVKPRNWQRKRQV
jgi:hypothetical protein